MLGPYMKAEAQKTLLYSSGIMIYFTQAERLAGFAKLRHTRGWRHHMGFGRESTAALFPFIKLQLRHSAEE